MARKKVKKTYQSPTITYEIHDQQHEHGAYWDDKFKKSKKIERGLKFKSLFHLIILIVVINFIGITDSVIASKHYIKPLDDSVIYYDVNIADGTITQLQDVDNLDVYNNSGHIMQSVYNYDWLNKFTQLDDLKPVFKFDNVPSYSFDQYNYVDDITFFERYIMPYGKSRQYYNNVVRLLEYNYITWSFNADNQLYYLIKSSNIYFTDFDNSSIDWINSYVDRTFNQSDFQTFTKNVVNFVIFPLSIAYNIGYDFYVILRFIFKW